MLILDKYKVEIFCKINLLITSIYTLLNVRFNIIYMVQGRNITQDMVIFDLINLLFLATLILCTSGYYAVSKHLFFTAIIVAFIELNFFEKDLFLQDKLILVLPVVLSITFSKKRYILIYGSVILFTVIFFQTMYSYYKSYEFFEFVYILIFLIIFCTLYKKYSSKLEEIKKDSYKKIYKSTFNLLGRVSELKDDETQNHQERVGIITKILLKKMKRSSIYSTVITEEYMHDVINGSYLHDIGKIAINDSILLKKGKYTEDEFNIMKKHTEIGADLIKETQRKAGVRIFDTAIDIVKYHHEKWDGSGYPEGLKGGDIPLSARIMAVADVYDALLSKRRYKEAFSHDKSYRIIVENSSKHFDPEIIKCFKNTHNHIYDRIKHLL